MEAALFTDEELLDALTGAVLPLETLDIQDLAGSLNLSSGAASSHVWMNLRDVANSSGDSNSESAVSLTLGVDPHAFVQNSSHPAKRVTPKQEIDKLRAVAATLEEKVCELKRRRESTGASENTPFWKRVAIRLANEKSEAEQENIRLRTLVSKHESTIQNITKSVANVAQLSDESNIRPLRLQESHRPHGADKAYEQIFANVAAAYADLNGMIQNSQCETPVLWKGTRQVQIDMQQREGAQAISIRLEEARLAPFSFTMTTAHAWDFICRFNEEKSSNGMHRYFSSDRSCIYGECLLFRSMTPTQQGGQIVIRRFLERDRVVIVWVIMVTGEDGSTAPIQERGWCTFEPCTDDPIRSTLCRTWAHFAPQTLASHQKSQGSAIGSTADTVVGVYDETVGSLHDDVLSSLVENLQLSEEVLPKCQ